MKPAPIIIFVYNRPWHTQQTIEALQKNKLALESELFIYSDAAKNDTVKQSVLDVRSYIKSIDGFKKITIIQRENNWGLANSIIGGVTTIINQYGKVIVLEDDLVTSPYFLQFMNTYLALYEKNERIGSVTGYIPYIKRLPEQFFLKFGSSLGWGTWARVWDKAEFNVDALINKIGESKRKKEFNMDGIFDYYAMLHSQKNKSIDSWAIRFTASTFNRQLLHLRIGHSLVQHIGSDSGTHCNTNARSKEVDGIITDRPLKLLDEISVEEHKQAYTMYKRFYAKDKVTILERIKLKLNNFLKRAK